MPSCAPRAARRRSSPRAAPRRAGPEARPPGAATDAAAGRGRWPAALTVPLLLLLAVAVLYPGPLFQQRIFASSDARNSDAFRLIGDAALARGEYPQWNPYVFGGMPTFGSLSYVRFVYPPGALLDFLQTRLGFPPLTWALVHLLFGGLGVAWLLGRWGLPPPARLLGALIWILSPTVTSWVVHGHGSKLGAAMYLPWILGAALLVLAGGGRRAVALLALLLGLQIVRGHVQITYYTLLAMGALALWHTLRPLAGLTPAGAGAAAGEAAPPAVRWRRLAALAGGTALAFLLGSVLLLPVRGYARQSIRGLAESGGGADYEYATNWSLAPAELPTLVLPSASGFGKGTYQGPMPFTDYPNYFGLLTLGLAAASAWSSRRRLAAALATLSLLSLLIAFGRHGGGLYDLCYRLLPYFNKFRVPVMILIVPTLALALLAPLGAAWLAGHGAGGEGGRGSEARRLVRAAGAAALAGLLLLLGAAGGRSLQDAHLGALAAAAGRPAPGAAQLAAAWALHAADLARIGALLVAAGAAFWWAARRDAFRRRGLVWCLAGLLAADLLAVDVRITHPERSLREAARDAAGNVALVPAAGLLTRHQPSRQALAPGPAALLLAEQLGHERVWPLGEPAYGNDFMTARVRSLGGYHPAKLAAFEQVRQRLNDPQRPAGRLASWLAGRIVAVPGALPEAALPVLAQLGADLEAPPALAGELALYRNRSALPRARLVDRWRLAAAVPEAAELGRFLEAVQSGQRPVAAEVVLDRAPEPPPVTAAAPLPAPEFVVDELNEVVLRTRAATPAILVLADLQAPGWSVEIDGRPAPALRADLILRAAAVPAGEHTVRWRYRDPHLRAGLMLSALGTALLLLLSMPRARRRRAPARGARAGGAPAGDAEAARSLPEPAEPA